MSVKIFMSFKNLLNLLCEVFRPFGICMLRVSGCTVFLYQRCQKKKKNVLNSFFYLAQVSIEFIASLILTSRKVSYFK